MSRRWLLLKSPPTLESLACRFFVLTEGVGIDIQRCRWLTMPQQVCYCCHIRSFGDEEACVGVSEGMHIQIFRQTVFLEELLEPEGEGGGGHWKFCDEIAVFHDGGVIRQGSHDSLLLDESGKYYELWNAQAQYYTEKTA